MLFDQIASNKRRTWFLLIAFFGLLALIGAAVGYLWLDLKEVRHYYAKGVAARRGIEN